MSWRRPTRSRRAPASRWRSPGGKSAFSTCTASFSAIADRCPHEGASLCKGRIVGLAEASEPGKYRLSRSGELVRCPWHGWEFDIRTGKSWCDPQRLKVRSFDVRIESGAAKVEGPYEVETFPVAIEKQLIVVEI